MVFVKVQEKQIPVMAFNFWFAFKHVTYIYFFFNYLDLFVCVYSYFSKNAISILNRLDD